MEDSILTNIKKILGVSADYTAFDMDILMHINSAFATLNQIGIGPPEGFQIASDEEVWGDFVGEEPRYNAVKSYVYLKTRLLFDPPTTSFLLDSIKEEIQQYEWRLQALREEILEEVLP